MELACMFVCVCACVCVCVSNCFLPLKVFFLMFLINNRVI